jgi:hypothetical protein
MSLTPKKYQTLKTAANLPAVQALIIRWPVSMPPHLRERLAAMRAAQAHTRSVGNLIGHR